MSKMSLMRKVYSNFDQLSEEEYRTLISEASAQEERDFYYYLYNRMLAKKQEKVIRRKIFIVRKSQRISWLRESMDLVKAH